MPLSSRKNRRRQRLSDVRHLRKTCRKNAGEQDQVVCWIESSHELVGEDASRLGFPLPSSCGIVDARLASPFLLLLQVCFIKTTNLDGESNLKIRRPVDLKENAPDNIKEVLDRSSL